MSRSYRSPIFSATRTERLLLWPMMEMSRVKPRSAIPQSRIASAASVA